MYVFIISTYVRYYYIVKVKFHSLSSVECKHSETVRCPHVFPTNHIYETICYVIELNNVNNFMANVLMSKDAKNLTDTKGSLHMKYATTMDFYKEKQ